MGGWWVEGRPLVAFFILVQENEQLTGLTKKQKVEITKLRSDLEKSVSDHKIVLVPVLYSFR